ncbi:MAG: hypothetical protein E6G60_21565 [Actinobacteria bacterium]|nr:MAG: hypothetical protein E6G60_21565 [Actinomycetota bacterium]
MGVRKRHGVEATTLALDLTAPDAADQILAVTDGLEVGLLLYCRAQCTTPTSSSSSPWSCRCE